MHLNYDNAYPRLVVNYCRKKLHHICEIQNIGIILIPFIICNYLLNVHHFFDREHFHEKKNILQILFLTFSKNKSMVMGISN